MSAGMSVGESAVAAPSRPRAREDSRSIMAVVVWRWCE
jgi:hypothetical protein